MADAVAQGGLGATMSLLDRLAPALSAGPRPAHGLIELHREAVVPASLEETFAFFSDASNLERLTPPWVRFRIRTPPPIPMHEGAEIDYQIVLYGIAIPWKTRIDLWEPGRRFVDRQIIGPYRWWLHEHRFEATATGTRVIDHVEFLPRASWLTRALVTRDVNRIFDYRTGALVRVFTQD